MSDAFFLSNAPIVEAIVEIDCNPAVEQELSSLEEPAKERYLGDYPVFRPMFEQLHEFRGGPDGSLDTSVKRTLDTYRFFHKDQKQLVQVRRRGFSFNRLAPYPGLDDLLPEVQRVWRLYTEFAAPQQISKIQLRYINRIPIPPGGDGRVNLDDHLRNGPRIADEERLTFTGFLNQYTATDKVSGHQIATVLTAQPGNGDNLALIFDNSAVDSVPADPLDWPALLERIQSLRELKNHVFRSTFQETCLNQFR